MENSRLSESKNKQIKMLSTNRCTWLVSTLLFAAPIGQTTSQDHNIKSITESKDNGTNVIILTCDFDDVVRARKKTDFDDVVSARKKQILTMF